MGNSSSCEPQKDAKTCVPVPEPAAFALSPADEGFLRTAHKVLFEKQGGVKNSSLSTSTLETEFRLPPGIAAFIAGTEGATVDALIAVVTRCCDPNRDVRQAVFFEAFSKAGEMSKVGLKGAMDACFGVSAVVAEEFGGVKMGELKGNMAPYSTQP